MKKMSAWAAGVIVVGGAAFAASASGSGDHVAPATGDLANAAQSYRARFSAASMTMRDERGGLELSVRGASIGRGDKVVRLNDVEPRRESGRADYDRSAGIVEWYVNGPRGIEQGFNVAARPDGAGTLAVDVEIAGGLEPSMSPDGERVELRREGEVLFVYGELHANDARGAALPAHLEVIGGRIRLAIDDTRAAYPVTIDPLIWREQQTLLASDGAVQDRFGAAVAIDGDTAVVSASGKTLPAGACAGAVYVFVRSGVTWTEQQRLTASNGLGGDIFGTSVAIYKDTIVVGARGKGGTSTGCLSSGGTPPGAAYVFGRSAGKWTEQQILTAPVDAGVPAKGFGGAVAIVGANILVGASNFFTGPGSVYAFSLTGTTWSADGSFGAPDGATNDAFGEAIAMTPTTAVIGAYNKPVGADTAVGGAYVFVRAGSTWTHQQSLLANDAREADNFGQYVAIQGDTVLVGAPRNHGGNDAGADLAKGAAYFFTRTGVTWSAPLKVQTADLIAYDSLGTVALNGDVALIAAPYKPFASDAGTLTGVGAGYLFARSGASWTESHKLLARSNAKDDALGSSVALGTNVALLGASQRQGKGKVVSFAYALPEGDACTAGAACLSGFCVDGVCCDTACGGGTNTDCQACSTASGSKVNGTCGPASTTTTCRASAKACDVVESCDGTNITCPADTLAANGVACAGGTCLAGACVASVADAGPGGPTNDASTEVTPEDSSCGCKLVGSHAKERGSLAWLSALAVGVACMRRRRAA